MLKLTSILSTLDNSIGDYVTLGGRVAVRDHVNIAAKVYTLSVDHDNKYLAQLCRKSFQLL